MNLNNIKKIAKVISLILIIALCPTSMRAQQTITSSLAKDTITVTVNKVDINGNLLIRDQAADFPYPIMSIVSIIDNEDNPVLGLADTSQWIGPDEVAQIGLPVSEIWQPVTEYHLENPSFPEDRDLYNQLPHPLFTEVRNTTNLPTSVMLVMDVSTSMHQEIEYAKAGVQLYVELLRSVDRAGIIQFAGEVKKVQPLTNDFGLLLETINNAEISKGTAIYDAIMAAIQETKLEKGRRGIIIYTDGGDNSSLYTSDAVIDSALNYNIPVFTIALGNDTREDTLKQIANETGGYFFKAATPQEMEAIYKKLSEMIQNYYVMAHTSPDPVANNTWRAVDITVNTEDFYGRGVGQYFVSSFDNPQPADISVSLNSLTAATKVVDNKTLSIAQPGEIYEYSILIENHGPDRAYDVQLSHLLPDSVRLLDVSLPPQYSDQNSLNWNFKSIEAEKELKITLSVQLSEDVPTSLTELLSNVNLSAHNDSNPENNFDTDTVQVKYFTPIEKFDLSLTQSVTTKDLNVLNGDTVKTVFPGDSYSYNLNIKNEGPSSARDIIVWNVLPDSVTAVNFDVVPVRQSADTLFWQFDSLGQKSNISIAFDVTLANSLPGMPLPLTNVSRLTAEHDQLEENNFTSTTVYAIAKVNDLSLNSKAFTDTLIILNREPVPAVLTGNSYDYSLTVNNPGPATAHNITLWQILPDSVTTANFNILPVKQTSDTLFWQFDSLQKETAVVVSYSVNVKEFLPAAPFALQHKSRVFAENDPAAENNSAGTTVYAICPPQKMTDIAVTINSITDSSVVIEQNTFSAVKKNEKFEYQIKVRNLGKNQATKIRLDHTLPNLVHFFDSSMPPSSVSKDSLSWDIESLDPSSELIISAAVQVASELPVSLKEIYSAVHVLADNDTLLANNYDVDTVKVVFQKPQQLHQNYDLSLEQQIIKDTLKIQNSDSILTVLQGNSYYYKLLISNLGPTVARNFIVKDSIPDSVKLFEFNIQPHTQTNNELLWLFDSLDVGNSITIIFKAHVANSLPFSPFPLINSSRVIAKRDTLPENNFAVDTVFAIKSNPEPAASYDLSLTQQAITDTSFVLGDNSVQAVLSGDSYGYAITIENTGLTTAHNITLWDVFPATVTVSDFNILPATQTNDTLFWQFDSLDVGNRITILFKAYVADSLPFAPFPLVNSSRVIAKRDTLPGNNFAMDTVFAIKSNPEPAASYDLSLTQQANTDTSFLVDDDLVQAVLLGDSYSYSITIKNSGPTTAHNITLWDALPEAVTVSDFNIPPATQANDTLFWQFDSLTIGKEINITFKTTVKNDIVNTPFLLTNIANVSAEYDSKLENNMVSTQVYAIAPQKPESKTDVSIRQFVETRLKSVVGNDTLKIVESGETYLYTITITNESLSAAHNVSIANVLPDSVIAGNFQPLPELITSDSVLWEIDILDSQSSFTLKFEATVSENMPQGINLLINEAVVSAANEDQKLLSNNSSINTVFNKVVDSDPVIEATPPLVEIGGEISVQVEVFEPIQSWDIWVYLANGQIISDFADEFIEDTELTPDRWYEPHTKYSDTKLYTDAKQEQVIFELRTTNILGEFKTARTSVTVRSSNNFCLDRNVFVPGRDGELGIKFKLSSNREVRLEIFDIIGTKIATITEGFYNAGWNTYFWNGNTGNGQNIGSGFYLITIRSGGFTDLKKVMVIR